MSSEIKSIPNKRSILSSLGTNFFLLMFIVGLNVLGVYLMTFVGERYTIEGSALEAGFIGGFTVTAILLFIYFFLTLGDLLRLIFYPKLEHKPKSDSESKNTHTPKLEPKEDTWGQTWDEWKKRN